jgi:2-keto-4-pentenoate hydratase/2-oxohepta-3-ene-1,7-dioic acid hydratase in catechol pathway
VEIKSGNEKYICRRIFCIGKNYSEHIREMNTGLPDSPVIFCKPPTSLVLPGVDIHFPKHGKSLHHEVELVILIGREGHARSIEEAKMFIAGATIGLDLTMRDVQTRLRQMGHPWEVSKAFDQSAPIGDFISSENIDDVNDIDLLCRVNGEIRQKDNTGNMIFSVETLIVELSKIWKLLPGDLVYTGTPAGVGPLVIGDEVSIESEPFGVFNWKVVE